jgi:hypothetical protein
MAKLPYIQFYTTDWLGDKSVRMLSISARGLWMDMLCLMSEATPRGYLILNGKPITNEQLARVVGSSKDDVSVLVKEIIESGAASVTDQGCLYSRRIIRDEQRRSEQIKNGQKGGNPDLGKSYNLPGYLYFMQKTDGLIKIGISTNPWKRVFKIRKQFSDNKIEVLYAHKTEDMGESESIAHQMFSKFQVAGEWFRIPRDIVENVLPKGDTFAPLNTPLKGTLRASQYIPDTRNQNNNTLTHAREEKQNLIEQAFESGIIETAQSAPESKNSGLPLQPLATGGENLTPLEPDGLFTLENCIDAGEMVGLENGQSTEFYHHYAAQGWKLGNGMPISNLKSAMSRWKTKGFKFDNGGQRQTVKTEKPKKNMFTEEEYKQSLLASGQKYEAV